MITHSSSGKISDPLFARLLPSAATLDASHAIAKLGGYLGPISKAIAIVITSCNNDRWYDGGDRWYDDGDRW